MIRNISPLVALIFCGLVSLHSQSGFADSYVIDFATDDDGNLMTPGTTDLRTFDPYDDLFSSGVGVLLSTDSPDVRPLNLYDSEGLSNQDDDLQRLYQGAENDWVDGNLITPGPRAGEQLFNLLIINKDNTITTPNDNGTGGEMTLNFGIALTSFSFDFVDMDLGTRADIIFTDNSGGSPVSVTIPFSEFEDGSGSIHQTTDVIFGDRHANRILDITAPELGLSQFDEVTFDMRSSGGIGTLYFETVPEPSAALLFLLGGAGILFLRRPRQCRG